MAFKFPFTNYHELNLTWVLDQLKSLFEKSEENVTVIENYNGRLTAVETELPLVEETAQGAAQQAASAATLAQQAKSTADTAQENAIQAQGLAGTARQEAQQAQAAADAATQAAQQAQATAQNFDGRITQAENDAASALEASRSFENRVQAAITTANNAAQTATNAQGIATRADQNAALALDTLNSQRAELERIGAEQAALITEETENGKAEIEDYAQSVIDTIPADYTALSKLVDKKAPVIINSASGSVAFFDDGADDMKIQKLIANIEPIQAGSGTPSPDNVRPISGRTGAVIEQRGKNLLNITAETQTIGGMTFTVNDDGSILANGTATNFTNLWITNRNDVLIPNGVYIASGCDGGSYNTYFMSFDMGGQESVFIANGDEQFIRNNSTRYIYPRITIREGVTLNNKLFKPMIRLASDADATFAPYKSSRIPITFPSDAGVVYGGTLDVLTGKLTIDRGYFTITDSLSYSPIGNYGNYVNSIIYNPPVSRRFQGGLLCDKLTKQLDSSPYMGLGDGVWQGGSSVWYICVKSEWLSEKTLDGLKQWIANNTPSVCYYLETPLEITLTKNQLATLYGINNIWINNGEITIDYPADTKLYIDGKLAELQATILENI